MCTYVWLCNFETIQNERGNEAEGGLLSATGKPNNSVGMTGAEDQIIIKIHRDVAVLGCTKKP